MKFKKYIKESFDEQEDFVEDLGNPDAPSVIKDEIDNFYAPVEKLIEAGKFDEARAELDALEADLNEFEAENAKKKIFKFPQFMIDGQRKQLAALRAKLSTNESVSDMNRRCEKCNTLLNDGGTCLKCDDGEEEPIEESIKVEELSNREKLLRAYPELDFDHSSDSAALTEDLDVRSKLISAFPDVDWNFSDSMNEYLTEAQGAEVKAQLSNSLNKLADSDTGKLAQSVVKIVDALPDSAADMIFDKLKKSLGSVRLNNAQKKQIIDNSGDLLTDETTAEADTVEDMIDVIDKTDDAKKDPEAIKASVVGLLGAIALVEPTPVVDVITAVVSALPAGIVSKVVGFITKLTPNGLLKTVTEDVDGLSNTEKLIRAFPDVDWNFNTSISEDVSVDPEDDWYDDDYDIDDVEEDRRHAALYGGDRTYCKCGKKLVRTDWGSYCPDCEPETAQEEHERSVYDDDDIDEGFLTGMITSAAASLAGKAIADKISGD